MRGGYYSTNTGSVESYGNVAEIEFYDKEGNRLSGAAFGNGPSYGNNPNTTYHKASDGNVNTFYDYAYPHFGFAGIDLGAGNEKAVGKIRFIRALGSRGGSSTVKEGRCHRARPDTCETPCT